LKKLETVGLEYAYNKNSLVLKGINAQFESGRMYAILGESGGGKTTLLSLLGGLDEPTSGEILVNGKAVGKNSLLSYRKNEVAFIFQNYNLIDYLTPAENVRLSTKESPFPFLEKVGLTKSEATRSVLKLSGGQQQRVAIARAIASNAGILLADEPTGNLDEQTALVIIELLKSCATDNNKCVIVVTHSRELAQKTDVVLGLKNGLLEEIKL
jgi:putative ABC transport system ATP-binding protein